MKAVVAVVAIDGIMKAEESIAVIDGTSVVCLLCPELWEEWHLPNAQCMSMNCLDVW